MIRQFTLALVPVLVLTFSVFETELQEFAGQESGCAQLGGRPACGQRC